MTVVLTAASDADVDAMDDALVAPPRTIPAARVVDERWGTEKDVPNERKAKSAQHNSWIRVVERSSCCRLDNDSLESLNKVHKGKIVCLS